MPINYILHSLDSLLTSNSRIERAVGELKGEVSAVSKRVDRMEDREHDRKETKPETVKWMARDYVVAAGGLIFVLLALIGKISWLEAAGHMIGGK